MENYIKELKKYKINKEDILLYAISDIDDDYNFAKNYIIITKEYIIKAIYNNDKSAKYSFGGINDKNNHLNETKTPTLFFYEIKKDDELEIQREILGGELLLKRKEGYEFICRFSNSKINEFEKIKEGLKKVINNEEIDDDFKSENKKEACPKCNTLYPDQERKICPRCMDKKSIFIRVLGYFKEYKFKIIIMFISYILIAVLNLIWPYLSGSFLYDKVLAKNEKVLEILNIPAGKYTLLLLLLVLTMFLSRLTIQALGILHGSLTALIVPKVVAKIKQQVFDSMGRLSLNFYSSKQTGGLMIRVLDDANEVTGFFIDGIPYFFTNAMTIIFTCIIMFSINPLLSLASLILLPFLTFASYKMMPGLWNLYSKRHRASRKLNSQINDNISGARVVKAFGKEEEELKRFYRANNGVKVSELSVAAYDNRYYAMYTAVENIASFTVWGIASILILKKTGLEFGMLITFVGYVSQLNGPLDFMSFVFRWWTNSLNSAQRIFEIIDAVPSVNEPLEPVKIDKIKGSLKLSNVSFGYDKNKPILKDVSFTVNEGEMLGIVGRSGAGKSTLVNLISRLYDTDKGEIYIDGINIKNMSFKTLRSSIAMVSQETYIFMGSVAKNIAYAKPEADISEIIDASIKAGCHDFICKMPDGYDTIIGNSGRNLSGGEKQRISIARAILSNPSILILDEATSAVDTQTEQKIQNSLKYLVKGRTTLSIAHRLSTLKEADKLIVVDNGEIKEEGTHLELKEKKGIYNKLLSLQTKAEYMRGIE